jgi:hypothetical protein
VSTAYASLGSVFGLGVVQLVCHSVKSGGRRRLEMANPGRPGDAKPAALSEWAVAPERQATRDGNEDQT